MSETMEQLVRMSALVKDPDRDYTTDIFELLAKRIEFAKNMILNLSNFKFTSTDTRKAKPA